MSAIGKYNENNWLYRSFCMHLAQKAKLKTYLKSERSITVSFTWAFLALMWITRKKIKIKKLRTLQSPKFLRLQIVEGRSQLDRLRRQWGNQLEEQGDANNKNQFSLNKRFNKLQRKVSKNIWRFELKVQYEKNHIKFEYLLRLSRWVFFVPSFVSPFSWKILSPFSHLEDQGPPLWDDGILDPRDTRQALSMALSVAHNVDFVSQAPPNYGVFRP